MKKVYLIHGWDGSPGELYSWLASELKNRGFEVEAVSMPNPEKPVIESWVTKLNEVIGPVPGKDIILLGHSIGAQAILRYLEGLKSSGLFGGLVFIAPWLYVSGLETQEEEDIAKSWVETPIDNPKVFKHIPPSKFIAIFSDNDPFVPKENWEMFETRFGAKVIVEKEKGHITPDEGVTNLPSALEAVLELSS